MQARYTVDCLGHFGLACEYYTHFTSPIRRYPDLQIHRIIKEHLRGKLDENRVGHYSEILDGVVKQSCAMERRAVEAEREITKIKKIQYIQNHIGDVYEGTITSIVSWGMYIELANTIEGFVSIHGLGNDSYYFSEENYEMVPAHHGEIYKLGQKVKVWVVSVDVYKRTIDFKLILDDEE